MTSITRPYHFEKECFQIGAPPQLVPTIEAAVRTLVPNVEFAETGQLLQVCIDWEQGSNSPFNTVVQLAGTPAWQYRDLEIVDPRYTRVDRERRVKERVRQGVFFVLEQAFDLAPSPWGILTGVRPTKLVHSMLDRGFSNVEVKRNLQEVYGVSPSKINLLMEVVQVQRPYFHSTPNRPVGIYVGIPFCPTRCSYCSFAAYPLHSHGHLFQNFLAALQVEIKAVGKMLQDLGVEVETVYLGGGTPTTVRGTALEELLGLIRDNFITDVTKEFTVEAGRPETLSLRTLQILKAAKVDRISINPQTMHDDTLELIGRKHSVEQVYTAFALAREVGIPVINADIILGLPQENLSHVEQTLTKLSELEPDNLTVHSLALKRASRLKSLGQKVQIAQAEGEAMATLAKNAALNWGMRPYYLYRQRYIAADLENVGYAKPGLESPYNIQMMEERQTILALGGGGITKLVAPDLTLQRVINPKCPATYRQQVMEKLEGKIAQIRQHLIV